MADRRFDPKRKSLKPSDITREEYWVLARDYEKMAAESGNCSVVIIHESGDCMDHNSHSTSSQMKVTRDAMKRLVNGPVIVYRCKRCNQK